jgi:hypothetical protein
MRRIPIHAGFTCPTRDGTLGTRGCLYCDAGGSRAARARPALPIREQIAKGIEPIARREPSARFIAYFQAFTNTYAPPEQLRATYEEALGDNRVAALAIGTRPDCLSEPVLDVLEALSRRTYLWVEVGLQSACDATLRAVGRGHTVAQFAEAVERLRRRSLRFLAHVILGLPGDSRGDMMRSAELLNSVGAWGVKIHNLYINRESPIAEAWERGEIPVLGEDEYLDLLVEYLTRLSPAILVHRLVGETPRERLLAPQWCADKQTFLRELDRRFEQLGTWQGRQSGPPGKDAR